MRSRRVFFAALFAATMSCGAAFAGSLRDTFPLGVYMSWHVCQENADAVGISKDEYVDRLMALVRRMNCDTVWVVNGPGKEAPGFLECAERHGVKALLNSKLLRYCYEKMPKDESRLDSCAAESAATLGSSSAFLGYVLMDEPPTNMTQRLRRLEEVQHRHDPAHDSIMVVSPGQFPDYAEAMKFPAICADIYYFGGPRSHGSIPTPAPVSRKLYRKKVREMLDVGSRFGKNVWIMPQSFAEVRGPHYWDESGRKCVVEKGAYIHWRMPTQAEIRWQAWEALRAGAKGIVFFALHGHHLRRREDMLPGGRDYEKLKKENARLAELSKKMQETETHEIDAERTLTYPGGAPTPQFAALGECFGKIAPHRVRLLSAQEDAECVLRTDDKMCALNSFLDAKAGCHVGVIVNDDFEKENTFTVKVPDNVVRVSNLNGGPMPLSEKAGGFKSFAVCLSAGDDMLVEVVEDVRK